MSVLPMTKVTDEAFDMIDTQKLWDMSRNLSNKNKVVNAVEKDNQKIMVFDIHGMSKYNIAVDTEFENKSKKLFIRIDGEYHNDYLEVDREIHEKVYIDTDVYEKYDFKIECGLLILILFEKINEQPEFSKVEEQQ